MKQDTKTRLGYALTSREAADDLEQAIGAGGTGPATAVSKLGDISGDPEADQLQALQAKVDQLIGSLQDAGVVKS